MIAIYILVGLVLLAIGGDIVVRGAVTVARKLGVSELLIGLTLLGFGTSAPELVTSVNAALNGAPAVAVGNVVGSNISNVLLVFALAAIIMPVDVDPKATRRDGGVMVAAAIAAAALALTAGHYSALAGWVALVCLGIYLVFIYFEETRSDQAPAAQMHAAEAEQIEGKDHGLAISLGLVAIGIAALVFGADLLVKGAVDLARQFGMSETVIGLTIVAIGTSLPELVATLAAALKGRSDVAFGNIVGSNIYNVLAILGVTAIVRPIDIPADMMLLDWGVFILSAIILVIHAITGARVTRTEGFVMLAMFVGYMSYLVWRAQNVLQPA